MCSSDKCVPTKRGKFRDLAQTPQTHAHICSSHPIQRVQRSHPYNGPESSILRLIQIHLSRRPPFKVPPNSRRRGTRITWDMLIKAAFNRISTTECATRNRLRIGPGTEGPRVAVEVEVWGSGSTMSDVREQFRRSRSSPPLEDKPDRNTTPYHIRDAAPEDTQILINR